MGYIVFVYACSVLSHVCLFATAWTVARQAPLSMGFPKQEYWSGLPFTLPGDLPNPGIEPTSPTLQVVTCIFTLVTHNCLLNKEGGSV